LKAFEVINSGFLTTFQDLGRIGYLDIGVGPSGAIDEYSYKIANILLEEKNKCCLEIAFGGVRLRSFIDTSISLFGAICDVVINGKKFFSNRTFKIKKGDLIEIKPFKEGNFLYFCIKGGFKVEKFLDSCSVNLREEIGKKLENKDILFANEKGYVINKYARNLYISSQKEIILRIVFGYEDELFDKSKFLNTTFKLKTLNRQAAVLSGRVVPKKGDIISNGIAFGAVQVPKSGEPIILLKERQSIGGYPKIGSVLPLDLFKLSQLRSGSTIMFKEISPEVALKEMIEYEEFVKRLELLPLHFLKEEEKFL